MFKSDKRASMADIVRMALYFPRFVAKMKKHLSLRKSRKMNSRKYSTTFRRITT
jgi:hypothetical protein